MKGAFLLILCCACRVFSQSADTVMTIYGGVADDIGLHRGKGSQNARSIYRIKGETKVLLWRSASIIKERTVSPDRRYIAVVTEDSLEGEGTLNYTHSFHLAVIDSCGNPVKEIDDGIRPSWSPREGRFAFIKALRVEEGMGYSPTSCCIYDISDLKETELDFRTYDLNWDSSDGLIYYLDLNTGRVKTYDPESGRSSPIAKGGIYVSPDGKYCFSPHYEGGDFALYVDDDRDISTQVVKTLGVAFVQSPEWVEAHTLLLRNQRESLHAENTNMFYDPESNRGWEFKGTVIGSTIPKSWLCVMQPDGSMKLERVQELKKLEK